MLLRSIHNSFTVYIKCLLHLCLAVSVVPGIANISRLSAANIRVIWNRLTLEESRGFLLSYTVAFIDTKRATCPEVDTETNMMRTSSGNSQLVISNLDPRLEYCVAIAASTVAGISEFSEGQKVPCKYHKHGRH